VQVTAIIVPRLVTECLVIQPLYILGYNGHFHNGTGGGGNALSYPAAFGVVLFYNSLAALCRLPISMLSSLLCTLLKNLDCKGELGRSFRMPYPVNQPE
jgi:hypothetical protein